MRSFAFPFPRRTMSRQPAVRFRVFACVVPRTGARFAAHTASGELMRSSFEVWQRNSMTSVLPRFSPPSEQTSFATTSRKRSIVRPSEGSRCWSRAEAERSRRSSRPSTSRSWRDEATKRRGDDGKAAGGSIVDRPSDSATLVLGTFLRLKHSTRCRPREGGPPQQGPSLASNHQHHEFPPAS